MSSASALTADGPPGVRGGTKRAVVAGPAGWDDDGRDDQVNERLLKLPTSLLVVWAATLIEGGATRPRLPPSGARRRQSNTGAFPERNASIAGLIRPPC